MKEDPAVRMNKILRERVKDAPIQEIKPPPNEVRLTAAPFRIDWLPREQGLQFVLSSDGVFCIEGSRVLGEIVYTAWKRSTLHKWMLGSRPDLAACKRLCEAAMVEIPQEALRYDLETKLTRFAAELSRVV